MTPIAIRFARTGGPEVLEVVDHRPPPPGCGEVTLRHEAIGVNFIDTYHRTGLYPVPLPSGLGLEAVGIVEALGDGVEDVSIGQRLGYATGPLGAYATLANVPAARAVAVPDGIDPVALATGLLKGMTARYLLEATFPVQRGDSILVQAAAGGVGQILLQWARHLGAETIAVVGSRPKADVALAAGATHVLVRGEDDIAAQARRLTGGEGVAVVYDSVGRDTFAESLDSLRPTGTMVSYGNASGPVPPVDPGLLAVKGSLFLTRPTLMHYVRTRALLEETAGHLFDMVLRGVVTLPTPRTLELADAADAHRLIESRAHAGTIALLP